jgi:hypothetical protein
MQEHDCSPPTDRRSKADDRWTCPDCGDVWRAEEYSDPDAAPAADFEPGRVLGVGYARWVRVGARTT